MAKYQSIFKHSLCWEACHAFQATARTSGLQLEGVGSCRGALRLEIPSFSCFWEEGKQSIILPYLVVWINRDTRATPKDTGA